MDGKDMMFLYILVPIRVMLCLVSKHQDADGWKALSLRLHRRHSGYGCLTSTAYSQDTNTNCYFMALNQVRLFALRARLKVIKCTASSCYAAQMKFSKSQRWRFHYKFATFVRSDSESYTNSSNFYVMRKERTPARHDTHMTHYQLVHTPYRPRYLWN